MKQTRDHPMNHTTKETAVITPPGRVTAARLAIRAARPRRRTSIVLWAAQIPPRALCNKPSGLTPALSPSGRDRTAAPQCYRSGLSKEA